MLLQKTMEPYIRLSEKELVPALGRTEPTAAAYAAADPVRLSSRRAKHRADWRFRHFGTAETGRHL